MTSRISDIRRSTKHIDVLSKHSPIRDTTAGREHSEVPMSVQDQQQKLALDIYWNSILPAAIAAETATTTAFSRSKLARKTGNVNSLTNPKLCCRDATRISISNQAATLHTCTIAMLVVVEDGSTNSDSTVVDTNNHVNAVTGPPTTVFSSNPACVGITVSRGCIKGLRRLPKEPLQRALISSDSIDG